MRFEVVVPNLDVAVWLSSRGFDRPITQSLIDDVGAHLDGDLVFLIVEDDTGEDINVGFATFTFLDELLYLNGIMLDPEAHGRAYAQEAIEFARLKSASTYLAFRTQNPRMWSVGRRLCSTWLPDVDDPEADSGLREMIERLAEKRSLPYPIHAGCYGEPLYGEKPTHRDPSVQQWWDSICNFELGDGIVCVGRF